MVGWLVNKGGSMRAQMTRMASRSSIRAAGRSLPAAGRRAVAALLSVWLLVVAAGGAARQTLDRLTVAVGERTAQRGGGFAFGGEDGQGIVEYIIIIAIIVGIIIFVLIKFTHVLGGSFNHTGNCVSNPTSCSTGNPVHGLGVPGAARVALGAVHAKVSALHRA